ncbi:PAS domain-containing protein [Nisaea sp.]|uniref:PAS domain-containing protein n=1 Tax=Nisaea sp. TaxID=2024842 RepID=UPI003B529B59
MSYGDSSSLIGTELDALSGRMRTESLKVLLDHWRVIKGPLLMPSRRQIDPVEFGAALPRIWLCDYEQDSDRFRYRLTGERVAKRFGHQLSRRYLDDNTNPDYYPRVHRYYRNVVDLPAALYIYGRLYAETSNPIHGERLLLPLSDDGRTVQNVIGATAEIVSTDSDGERFLPEYQKHTYVALETGAVIEESLPV